MDIHEIIHAWETNALPDDIDALAAVQNKVDDYKVKAMAGMLATKSEMVGKMYSAEVQLYSVISSDIDGIVNQFDGEKRVNGKSVFVAALHEVVVKGEGQSIALKKHTGGNWEISAGLSNDFEIISPNDEGVIAFVPLQDNAGIQGLANANLISAAPELLESLIWLFQQIQNLEGEISLIGTNLCQDAILKATGGIFQEKGGTAL